jgi:hypothetical protein
VSVVGETWTMLTTYEDMISAFIATGTLVAITPSYKTSLQSALNAA